MTSHLSEEVAVALAEFFHGPSGPGPTHGQLTELFRTRPSAVAADPLGKGVNKQTRVRVGRCRRAARGGHGRGDCARRVDPHPPFVNGHGRTARLLAAHISLRYGLPIFVTLKPRPDDVAYARAARQSMGRPPAFIGDHSEATAVFVHLLALRLLGS